MRTVVTGVDHDEPDQVLRRALDEARSSRRPLEVVHAWSPSTWPSSAIGLDDPRGLRAGTRRALGVAADLLDRAQDAQPAAAPVQAHAFGTPGDAGDLLVRAGREAGLVVVGARSHGALLSAACGSATGFVLHYAACPVMVVPRTAAAGPYRRVVLGYDDATHAGSALRWALDAARRHAVPLLVVCAHGRTSSPSRVATQARDARYEDRLRTWLATQVAWAAQGWDDVPVTTTVRDGDPLEVLLAEAGPEELLVLGSRAHSGAAEVLLGSTAVQCAQRATGVVVVVRSGQERLDDPAGPPSPAASWTVAAAPVDA